MTLNQGRVQLATLIKELPVSKGSVFQLLKNMGIERQMGHGPDGKGRVAWIAQDDAELLINAANQVANGSQQINDFIAKKARDRRGAQININLPSDLLEQLKTYATTNHRTVSELLRGWIEVELSNEIDLSSPLTTKSEIVDLVDIITLLRDEVLELKKSHQSHHGKHFSPLPLKALNGISKRKTWKTCAFYLQPATFEKLQRYVLELKLAGKEGDQSDIVDCALQMWMDDLK